MLASRMSGTLANRFSRKAIVVSVGRPYIHDSRPRANMFFARAASLRERPNSLTASTVIPVRSSGCTAYAAERVVVERARRRSRPWRGCGAVKSWVSTMIVAPWGRSPRLARSAAGFIATSTSGASPGVRMSWSAKCTWNDETPGQRALRGPDLGGEVGQRRQVVAERGGLLGEPVPGQLHAVAGVAGEPDDDAVELLDLLGATCGCTPLPPGALGDFSDTVRRARSCGASDTDLRG